MDQTRPLEAEADFTEAIGRVLRICKKGRWLIAATALLTVVGINAALRFVPDKYRSEATILVAADQISPNFVTPYSTTPLIERVKVAAREVLSQSRLLDIAQESGLLAGANPSPDATVEGLRKNIEIEPATPYSFRISFTAGTPQLAQSVAKKLVDLFIARHLELEANQVQTAATLIQEELADRRKKVLELEERMRAVKVPPQYAGDPSDELERSRQAQSRLDMLTGRSEHALEQRTVLESALVGSLNARLARLQDERAVLLRRFTSAHPDVVSKDLQIARAEAEIESVKTAARTHQSLQSPLAFADPSVTQAQWQLEANALEIDNLSRETARQTATLAQHRRRQYVNPVPDQQLSAMALEKKELNDEIAELARKQQQSGFAGDMQRRQDQQQFRLVDPPNLPTHPSSGKRQKASLAAVVVGPLLGFLLAFLLDLRISTFQTEKELGRKFAPPLVLSIPVLPTPKERRAQTWQTAFELAAGGVMAIVIAATEFYAYRLLS